MQFHSQGQHERQRQEEERGKHRVRDDQVECERKVTITFVAEK